MLKISGDTILLDDFEVAVIKMNIPPSQRENLEMLLNALDDILEATASTCDECGRMVVGSLD